MSAQEYRARAAALIKSADGCVNYDLILQLEAVAQEWRKLAEVADWQDALQSALRALDD